MEYDDSNTQPTVYVSHPKLHTAATIKALTNTRLAITLWIDRPADEKLGTIAINMAELPRVLGAPSETANDAQHLKFLQYNITSTLNAIIKRGVVTKEEQEEQALPIMVQLFAKRYQSKESPAMQLGKIIVEFVGYTSARYFNVFSAVITHPSWKKAPTKK